MHSVDRKIMMIALPIAASVTVLIVQHRPKSSFEIAIIKTAMSTLKLCLIGILISLSIAESAPKLFSVTVVT